MDADTQYEIGVMHAQGQVVEKDSVLAHMWFTISASSGNKHAQDRLNELTRHMNSTQIMKAQAQEKAWRRQSSNYKNCD